MMRWCRWPSSGPATQNATALISPGELGPRTPNELISFVDGVLDEGVWADYMFYLNWTHIGAGELEAGRLASGLD